MSSRAADRIQMARRQHIIGREEECTLFQNALTANELPFQILHIYGPGGIGKTTLLHEFQTIAKNNLLTTIYLDARNVDAVPAAFINAAQRAFGLNSSEDLFQALAAQAKRFVILLDTFENLEPIDAWLSVTLWNQLPENVLIVIASLNPPSPRWRTEPGWETFLRILPLRNLNPTESQRYLTQHQIPVDQQVEVLKFTHGHPLALSLVADVMTQRPGSRFEPESAPDVIKILIDRLVRKVPSPAHRAALEACALVRVATESLLARMLQPSASTNLPTPESAHELFEWLRSLACIESGREGIFPHDLARDALVTDLRWRNPDWYKELHHRARAYYIAHIQSTTGAEQQRILLDYIFLHRDNAAIRPMLEWQTNGTLVPDAMRPSDRAALIAMVARHEGVTSAKLAEQWLDQETTSVTVFRNETGEPLGFIMILALERATPAQVQSDPATRLAWEFLQTHTPLRKGEIAAYYRFWMAHDTYQAVSAIQTAILLSTVRYQLTTPGLAYHFLPCADPDGWAMAFAYANLSRLNAIDFQIDGKRYGVYGHDWRIEPPHAWLAVLAEREVASSLVTSPPSTPAPLIVLSESEFAEAVRDAFHDFTDLERLQKNPLLQSRIIAERTGMNASTAARAMALQSILKQAAESLQASPKQNKLYRALCQTYLEPSPTQEAAAEVLDLPFSTYRRHLKAGLESIIGILWGHEIGK